MKKIFICFILLLFILPAVSQDKKEPVKENLKKKQVKLNRSARVSTQR